MLKSPRSNCFGIQNSILVCGHHSMGAAWVSIWLWCSLILTLSSYNTPKLLSVHWYYISPAQPQVTACLVGPHAAMAATQSGRISTARQTTFKLLVIMQWWQATFYPTHYLQNSQCFVYLLHRKASLTSISLSWTTKMSFTQTDHVTSALSGASHYQTTTVWVGLHSHFKGRCFVIAEEPEHLGGRNSMI